MSKNLNDLIKTYGNPDGLIDNYCSKYGYAIWGFEECFYQIKNNIFYNDRKIDCDSFSKLQELINIWIKKNNSIKTLGFLSYDIKNIIYPHLSFKDQKSDFPYFWFGRPKMIKPYLINNNYSNNREPFLSRIKDVDSFQEYSRTIKKIKNELKNGNTYQINYTMNQDFQVNLNPMDIFLSIRESSRPTYGYYINIGDYQILSFSPESFFKTKDKNIFSYPMKGTINNSKNEIENKFLMKKLQTNPKDKSEHIMIVDLLRNDLGKICEYNSIQVKDLFSIKTYPTINQMVSCVHGKLKENIRHIDIFKALCPGGSITGAPKESSMKIIDLLENYNREIYTGSIGHIDSNNNMYFNIAIRTMLIKNNIARYSTGGGIVWDSKAKDEWEEAKLKSNILNQFIKE